MKKIFFALSIGLMAVFAEAQTLTAKEMIEKTKCTDFDCYSEFITSKGFTFFQTSESGLSDMYTFVGDKFIEDGNPAMKTKNTSIINIDKVTKVSGVGFRTASKAQYQILLKQFKAEKFKAQKTGKYIYGKGVQVNYSSSKYPNHSLVVVTETMTKDNIEWVTYDFQIQAL